MPNLQSLKPAVYSLNRRYFFTIYKKPRNIKIVMECVTSVVNTSQLPDTCPVLEAFLPSIFTSKCFNEEGLEFFEEVKKTELGHLFEHIMLEYICQEKVALGASRFSVSGFTDWNWKRDSFGTFNITIKVGRRDFSVFMSALERSIELLEVILSGSVITKKKQMAFI